MRDIMKLQDNLIRLRKAKGYSQEELAFELGVSRQSVSKWESGMSTPELERLIEIAEFYQVSLDELVLGKEKQDIQESHLTDEHIRKVLHIASTYEYKSRLHIGKLPLVHIHFGRHREVAKGIIAIGNIAFGVLSLGGLSIGAISLGGLSLGLLALGGGALGLFSIGGFAVGVIAIGGLALGLYCYGGTAIAMQVAIGGLAKGYIAIGESASGTYALDHISHQDWQTIDAFVKSLPADLPQWIKNLILHFL